MIFIFKRTFYFTNTALKKNSFFLHKYNIFFYHSDHNLQVLIFLIPLLSQFLSNSFLFVFISTFSCWRLSSNVWGFLPIYLYFKMRHSNLVRNSVWGSGTYGVVEFIAERLGRGPRMSLWVPPHTCVSISRSFFLGWSFSPGRNSASSSLHGQVATWLPAFWQPSQGNRLQDLPWQGINFHLIPLLSAELCLNLESLNLVPFHFLLEWVTLLPVVWKDI